VISDVHMPRMTGLGALAWIRRAKPLIPVILITAFGGLEAHREGMRLGAAAVLDKPFKFATLLDVVHRVLGQG
jgi:DNA-binding NtrC family response regulator